MSDTILRIIPRQPDFSPDGCAQGAALSRLRDAFDDADDIAMHLSESIQFVDAGENFEGVYCPACDTELDHTWWTQALEAAAANGFTNLRVRVPCCNDRTTLNDLRYDNPQGFARFVLEVTNPNVDEVSEALIEELQDVLGCDLKTVWARY